MRDDRPSHTAQMIAWGVLFWNEDRDVAPLIPIGAAEITRWFIEEASPRFNFDSLRSPGMRAFAMGVERFVLPGMSIHYVLRKRFIEEKVRAAIAGGFERVAILAGGFDTLAVRLHREFPNVQFIEFDHPATQRVKRAALERHQPVGENLIFRAVDLNLVVPSNDGGPHPAFGHPLPQAGEGDQIWQPSPLGRGCREAPGEGVGASESTRTFWVAEGLLMYLREPAVQEIFREIREQGKGRFLFTTMEGSNMRLVKLLLHLRGEPFRWHIDRDSVEPWLQRIGFRLLEMATPAELRRRYMSSDVDRRLNPPTGDILFLSEW